MNLKKHIAAQQEDVSRFLEFDNFYNPDLSNKDSIITLLNQVIELIENDESLVRAAKNKLISKIKKIIEEIQYPDSDWTGVLGAIKEVVIVLGAVGSIVGGATALKMAVEKLHEVEDVIAKTSINQNYFIENNFENRIIVQPQEIGKIESYEERESNKSSNMDAEDSAGS